LQFGTINLPKPKILAIVVANAKIYIDAKIGMDPKISINMKIGTNESIFYFHHTLGEISIEKHYTSSNQSAKHEDGKVEFIRRGPNSPFEIGYS